MDRGVWAQAALLEAPCSEPEPDPSMALLGVPLGRATALTLRENINFGTFLPEGWMQGAKQTAWLKRELRPTSPKGEMLPLRPRDPGARLGP